MAYKMTSRNQTCYLDLSKYKAPHILLQSQFKVKVSGCQPVSYNPFWESHKGRLRPSENSIYIMIPNISKITLIKTKIIFWL